MKKPFIEILPKMDASQAEISIDFMCPECAKSGINYDGYEKPNLVGWCDTEFGYMMICECPKCFTKYRFHGTAVNKNDDFAFEHAIRCYVLAGYFANSEELERKRNTE